MDLSLRTSAFSHWLRSGIALTAVAALLAAPATTVQAQGTGEYFGAGIERDTEIEAIMHEEMDPIFAAANVNPKQVELYLVADPTLNAATLPGYRMVVNSGLIMQCKTPNELQGVLAHETGHMAGGHVAGVGAATHGVVGPVIIGLGLGILAALAGAPDAAAALIYSGSYFGQINGLAFSRDQESRADEAAITYLEKAGYSADGLVEFFDNFRYEEVFSDAKKYPFWVDHPPTDEADRGAGRCGPSRSRTGTPQDTPEAIAAFEIMKAKIKAFTNSPGPNLHRLP